MWNLDKFSSLEPDCLKCWHWQMSNLILFQRWTWMDSLQGRLEIEPGQSWLKCCFIPNHAIRDKNFTEIQYSLRILLGIQLSWIEGQNRLNAFWGTTCIRAALLRKARRWGKQLVNKDWQKNAYRWVHCFKWPIIWHICMLKIEGRVFIR